MEIVEKKSKRPYGEMRELILSASYDLVGEKGIGALSARKIASKIGYTVGTLYNIFTNMDEIALYVKNRVLNNFIEELTLRLAESNGAIDSLRIIARYYVSFSEDDYHLWHVLFIDTTLAVQDELPNWYLLKVNKLHDMIAHQISLLNISNNVELEAGIYWAGVHGVASLNKSKKLRYMLPEEVNVILEHIVDRIFSNRVAIQQ